MLINSDSKYNDDQHNEDHHNGSQGTKISPSSVIALVIEWSVAHRIFVALFAAILAFTGFLALQRIPLDAIPDLSDTQVIIRTEWPGQAPQVIEDQVTYPLSVQMLNLPKTKAVRGFSMFGTSFVYIVFDDDVDIYWARNRVTESLSQVRTSLPDGVDPQLGPDATGVGWVFQYALFDRTGQHDLSELRSLQDWFIRLELLTVEGVAEVASVGGFVKEYQVVIDPNKLRAFNVSLKTVIESVRSANQETGGRTMEMAETEYLIRSYGYVTSVGDIEQAVIHAKDGNPITVGDVAKVIEGPAIRRGVAELNGIGEVVGGIVVVRSGVNSLNVIDAIKEHLDVVRQGLPPGVEVKVVYDRSALIKGSVRYLSHKLIEESLIVAAITFLFLLHLRSVFVAIITLPLGVLAAFSIMSAQGISVNIMSLGGIAIAIGAMVDASIVMVESAHQKLSELSVNASQSEQQRAVIQAMKEVGPGLFFSLLIITVSFLPVFALTGQSEKLFAPLAYTKTYAMAAAALLSVTVVPALMIWFVRGTFKSDKANPVNRIFTWLYRPLLDLALRYRKTTLLIFLFALVATFYPAAKLGREFMPPLDEGGIMYMPMTLPGVSVTKAREILQVTNRQIMAIPEIKHVFGKAGRADTATDPAPLSMIETWIELKPRSSWRKGMTSEKLMAELDRQVRLPGMMNMWGYPIKIRIDMLTSGIRTPVGIKVSGDDLAVIDNVAKQVEVLAKTVDGTRSAIADRVVGGKYIEILPDRREIARHGIAMTTVQSIIQTALGGMKLDEAVIGRERYPIIVRYDRPFREHISDLDNILVSSPSGAHIPLADLATIKVKDGPSMIKSEDARLNGWVFVDMHNRDLASYIKDLKKQLKQVAIPRGYTLTIAGQFEQMQQASEQLSIAVPAVLFIIIVLLYMYFGCWNRTALIVLSLPFAVLGGVWGLWLVNYNLSVAVVVGFIALAGVAAETAIVMLIYIDQQMRHHFPNTVDELLVNVRYGALKRLRPKLMTVMTIVIGLIPIFITDGPGSDVMRRIALPMVWGMLSTMLLTLILIPVIYSELMCRKYGLLRSS